jgi:hypothetical protein
MFRKNTIHCNCKCFVTVRCVYFMNLGGILHFTVHCNLTVTLLTICPYCWCSVCHQSGTNMIVN